MNYNKRKQQLLASGLALLLVASLVTSVSLVAIQPARAQTPISSCTTITQPGEYEITQDIEDITESPCIEIRSDNVALNGNGHLIDGVSQAFAEGISINGSNHTNIENIRFRDLGGGIVLRSGSSDVSVADSSFSNNSIGIFAFDSVNNNIKITNNNFLNNSGGITLDVVGDSSIIGNNLTSRSNDPESGISLINSGNISILNNNIHGSNTGIDTINIGDSQIRGNNVSTNNGSGIVIASPFSSFEDNNTVSENTVSSNNGDGIILLGTDQNTISENTVNNNGDDGIEVNNSSNNAITNNTICFNADEPIAVTGTSTGNTIENNEFCDQPGSHISVSPTSVSYGTVNVGDTASRTVTVTNIGTEQLNVSSTGIVGPNASEFGITNGGAPFTLAPGDSRQITVEFAPTSVGEKSASLQIESNDLDDPTVQVSLTGTGQSQAQQPNITVSPSSLNFGKVTVGDSKTKNVTVTNTGTGTLDVSATDIVGADASAFSVADGSAPFSLAPGESQNVTVEFAPTSKSTKHATLQIESNDPDEPITTVELCGKGVKEGKTVFPDPLVIKKHGKVLFKIGPPQDLNHDGLYEDVNGDRKFNFKDVVALAIVENAYQHDHLDLNSQQVAALDFNHDGKLTQKDVVALAIDLFKEKTGWHRQLKGSDLNKDGRMTARDHTLGQAVLNGQDLVRLLSADDC